VVQSLRTSRFGLPADTALFLLSALAYGGLITLLKGGRTISLEFFKLTAIENADAVAPGGIIGKHDRQTLMETCGFLSPAEGWGSFGLLQQREAWQAVVKFRKWAEKAAVDIEIRLADVAEFSAFEAFDLEALRSQLKALKTLCAEIKISYPAREGLERFLKTWRATGFSSEDIDYLKSMRTFFSRQAEQFVFINHYVHNTAVDRIASTAHEIAALQSSVIQLLDQPDMLIKEQDPDRLSETFTRFRTEYVRIYNERHTEHYQQFDKKPLSRFALRAFELLKRLASIDILDRPTGMNDLFRQLDGPKKAICKRNLAEELLRSPICNCGFIPGETAAPVQIDDPEENIERYLNEYLKILKQSDIREAIAARIFALADAEPETARRLKSLVTVLEDERSSSAALLDVLDDVTAAEISKALSGRVLIERRGLKDLLNRLGGRRLAPNQVMEAVKEWIAISDDKTVIALEGDGDMFPDEGSSSLTWWSMIHHNLFRYDTHLAIHELEAALERQYPSNGLKSKLARLEDHRLCRFLMNELFHTHAIRTAWLLYAERIISGAPWPDETIVDSRHVDRETAARINQRLQSLHRLWQLKDAHFPDFLRLRMPLSEMLIDPWASAELRSQVRHKIQTVAQAGEEWLMTLPAVIPIELTDNPLVLIIDGVSPDVWLDTTAELKADVGDITVSWYRLEVPPKTALSISAMFGFAADALDEFHARDIDYYQVKGDETHRLKDLLPEFAPGKPVVIRVSLVDKAAHGALLRLAEMPAAICSFLGKELPRMQEICAEQKRRLVLTTDHGLSLTPGGLSHGKGGVFERAVFRMEWPVEQ
jgi:hypothetical protein